MITKDNDRNFDHKKFSTFCQWLHDNTGKRFKMVEDGVFTTYKDHNKRIQQMFAVQYKDREVFMEYCKFYMSLYANNDTESINPQIEFSDDYSQFKIYLNKKKFYYDT